MDQHSPGTARETAQRAHACTVGSAGAASQHQRRWYCQRRGTRSQTAQLLSAARGSHQSTLPPTPPVRGPKREQSTRNLLHQTPSGLTRFSAGTLPGGTAAHQFDIGIGALGRQRQRFLRKGNALGSVGTRRRLSCRGPHQALSSVQVGVASGRPRVLVTVRSFLQPPVLDRLQCNPHLLHAQRPTRATSYEVRPTTDVDKDGDGPAETLCRSATARLARRQ